MFCKTRVRRFHGERRICTEEIAMSKENCASFMEEGNKFLQTARRSHRRSMMFNNTMIYHVLCLSIEKYLLGLFRFHNSLPTHNTLTYMIRDVTQFLELPPFLIEEITAMDNILNLCDPEAPLEASLTDDQLQGMLMTGERVREMVNGHILCAA